MKKLLAQLTFLLAATVANQVNGAQIVGTDFSDAPVFNQIGGSFDIVNLDDLDPNDGITVGQWVNLSGNANGRWETHTDNNTYNVGTPGFIPSDTVIKLDGIGPTLNVGEPWPSAWGNYFEITIPAGAVVNLTSLNFDWRAATGSSTSGRELAFGTDVSGTPTCTYNVDGIGRDAVPSPTLDVIDLSGPEYQGLTDRTLRFYFAAVEGGGSGDLEGDTIILNGEVLLGATLVWVGDGSANTWETNSLSWTNVTEGGGLTQYADDDSVIFDDSSANSLVTLTSTVAPYSVTVSNVSNTYVLTGGGISGVASLTKQGAGSLSLINTPLSGSGDTTIEDGTVVVDSTSASTLNALTGSGALTQAGSGALTLAGVTTFDGSVTVEATSTLGVEGTATIAELTFAAGATGLDIVNDGGASTIISAPNYTNAGTVAISYTAPLYVPGATTTLIDYDTNNLVGAYSLSLPAGVTGVLVTNVVNTSIDLLITSVPANLWAGTINNLWDIGTTANWSSPTTYSDGQSVKFDDTGSNTDPINVNFSGTVAPGLMWVINNTTPYTFEQGSINTPALVKQGTGVLALKAQNSFTTVDLQAGTLSYTSDFGASYVENATVTGSGTLQVDGTSTVLTLSGDMSGFDGPIEANSGATLTLGGNNVLGTTNGTTTIASGAALDVNGNRNVRGEQVIVSGSGPSGLGGIVNDGGADAQSAFDHVTLTGDTTFGGLDRWDIRVTGDTSIATNLATLDTQGVGPFNLIKEDANIVGLVSVAVSPNLGNITVNGGTLSFQYHSGMGDPAGTLTVGGLGEVEFWANIAGTDAPDYDKVMVLQEGATVSKGGVDPMRFVGPVTLQGTATLDGFGGELEFTGPVGDTGFGGVTKIGGATISLLGANTYIGGNTISNGTLKVSTQSADNNTTVNSGATLGAVVTSAGTTLTIPSLTLGSGGGNVELLFDLGTLGNPTAPVMQANFLTTNAATYEVTVEADLENLTLTGGTPITLLKYPAGAFTNDVVATLPAGMTGTVINNTAASEIQLTITAVSRALTWVGNESSDWDIDDSINWLNGILPTTYRELGAGDSVTFPDSASSFVVNVAETVQPTSVTVTGTNDYTIGGSFSIAGAAQLEVNTATDTTVTLTGNNSYTGGTDLNNGTAVISADANLGDPSGEILWRGGVLQITDSLTNTRPVVIENTGTPTVNVTTNKTALFGGTYTTTSGKNFTKTGEGELILTNSGTMRLWVDAGTGIMAGQASITNENATFGEVMGVNSNSVGTLILTNDALLFTRGRLRPGEGNGSHGTLRVEGNAQLLLGELLVARGIDATGLVYQTSGLISNRIDSAEDYWQLGGDGASDVNSFGGFYISGGVTELGLDNNGKALEVGAFGTGELEISGTGVMNARGNRRLTIGEEPTGVGTVTVSGSGQLNVLNAAHEIEVGNAGTGTLVVTNGGTVSSLSSVSLGVDPTGMGSVSVYANSKLATSGISKGGATNASSATLLVDGGTIEATADNAAFLEGLDSATIGAGGLTLDTSTNDVTINQDLIGSGGLTKTGSGKLTLNSQSYAGDTVVNAGTLGGNTEVAGTVLQGNLVVNAGGTIAPGSSIGTIYAANAAKTVTLGGTANMEIAKTGASSFLADLIKGEQSISLSGTLNVTLDPSHNTALAVGNSFQLFQAPTATGGITENFSTMNLPTEDPIGNSAITWNADSVNFFGQTIWFVEVATVTPLVVTDPPPTLTTVVAGGNYMLSWGGEYEGYTLQSQTNALSVGLSDNWVSIPGTETATNYTQAINPADPTVFFQLVYTNAP